MPFPRDFAASSMTRKASENRPPAACATAERSARVYSLAPSTVVPTSPSTSRAAARSAAGMSATADCSAWRSAFASSAIPRSFHANRATSSSVRSASRARFALASIMRSAAFIAHSVAERGYAPRPECEVSYERARNRSPTKPPHLSRCRGRRRSRCCDSRDLAGRSRERCLADDEHTNHFHAFRKHPSGDEENAIHPSGTSVR